MKTLLIIEENRLPADHPIRQLQPEMVSNYEIMNGMVQIDPSYELIIDADFEEFAYRAQEYDVLTNQQVLLLSVPTETLHHMYFEYGFETQAQVLGFNGLPYFFNQKSWEICTLTDKPNDKLAETLQNIGIRTHFVTDQSGLVAFRVLATIINEAYFMIQEGSASAKDIDSAMKLGVNYPKGPFEWAEEIGIEKVHQLLTRLKTSVSAETYKIAPALSRAAEKLRIG